MSRGKILTKGTNSSLKKQESHQFDS
jgi:hypothetical protein